MAEFDLIIKGGTVIDGTRMPRYRADVGVRDGVARPVQVAQAAADMLQRVIVPRWLAIAAGERCIDLLGADATAPARADNSDADFFHGTSRRPDQPMLSIVVILT